MRVMIENTLEKYMHEHHYDAICLELVTDELNPTGHRTRQTNTKFRHPSVHYAKPRHLENFDEYLVDDINVYVQKNIQCDNDTLVFVKDKYTGSKKCTVKGINSEFMKKME